MRRARHRRAASWVHRLRSDAAARGCPDEGPRRSWAVSGTVWLTMGRQRAQQAVRPPPGQPADYQCVRLDETWHATQEQAAPPPIGAGGAYTICSAWAGFTRGFERRRPTCAYCLRACEIDEGIAPTTTAAVVTAVSATIANEVPAKKRATAPVPVVEVTTLPLPPVVRSAVPQTKRDAVASEEADFNAKLDALVASTRRKR